MKKFISAILILGFSAMPITSVCFAEESYSIQQEDEEMTESIDLDSYGEKVDKAISAISEERLEQCSSKENSKENHSKVEQKKSFISAQMKETLKSIGQVVVPVVLTVGGALIYAYFTKANPKKAGEAYKNCFDPVFKYCVDSKSKGVTDYDPNEIKKINAECRKEINYGVCAEEYKAKGRAEDLGLAFEIGKLFLDALK